MVHQSWEAVSFSAGVLGPNVELIPHRPASSTAQQPKGGADQAYETFMKEMQGLLWRAVGVVRTVVVKVVVIVITAIVRMMCCEWKSAFTRRVRYILDKWRWCSVIAWNSTVSLVSAVVTYAFRYFNGTCLIRAGGGLKIKHRSPLWQWWWRPEA